MTTRIITQTERGGMINLEELFTKKEFICDKHGKQLVFVLKNEKAKCEICIKESKKQIVDAMKAREIEKEIEAKKLAIENNFKQALIPLRFQKHSFETYEATTKEQIYNKKMMLDYAMNFKSNLETGASIMLCGAIGNGKTHLACAVANYIIKNFNKTALFLNVVDAFSKIKATYTQKKENSEIEVLNQFCEIDLLILDEFGIQIGTEHEKLLLFRIINKRYENLKPTILISNLSAIEIKKFEERIFDRLKDGGFLLTFSGQSNRKPKKLKYD